MVNHEQHFDFNPPRICFCDLICFKKSEFEFRDILQVLGYKNLKDFIYNNHFDNRYKLKFNEIKMYHSFSTPLNFQKKYFIYK
jgi:hypothetical protein